jgi:hypothetical protein
MWAGIGVDQTPPSGTSFKSCLNRSLQQVEQRERLLISVGIDRPLGCFRDRRVRSIFRAQGIQGGGVTVQPSRSSGIDPVGKDLGQIDKQRHNLITQHSASPKR